MNVNGEATTTTAPTMAPDPMNGEAAELAPKSDSAIRRPLEFEPGNIDDAWRMATLFSKSGIIPEALIGKPNDVLVTMLAGRELGLSPIQSLRLVYVVKGKPYIATQLKMARVKNSPECIYFKCIETTDQRATFETERRGEGVTRVTFTIEDAKRAGLAGRPVTPGKESNWDKYPAVMLRWRAGSQLCDLVYSDVTNGVGSAEELDDMRRAEEASRVRAPSVAPTQAVPERVVGSSATPAAAQAARPELAVAPEPREPGADEDEEQPQTSAAPSPTPDAGPTPVELELEQIFAAATKPGELLRHIAKINALPEGIRSKWQQKFNARREELVTASKPA